MLLLPTLFTILLVIPIFVYRFIWLLPKANAPPLPLRTPGTPTHVLVVLGSGGHTAEMLAMLRDIDPHRITRRSYIVSSGDDFSATKAREFEAGLAKRWPDAPENSGGASFVGEAYFAIHTVPRARRIYQPLYTTPWSCAQCFAGCVRALRAVPSASQAQGRNRSRFPDLIITNGPATAVVVVFAALALKFVGLARRSEMRTVYVESFARVKKLSLSGRILLRVVDRFVVQWDALQRRVGGRAEYKGVLV